MNSVLRILLIEDDANDRELIKSMLMEDGLLCEFHEIETRSELLRVLNDNEFDLILSDNSLPSFDGLSALAIAQEKGPEVPFIFVSGTLGEEVAIESLKSGATDYVLKQRMARLVPAVRRALKEANEKIKRKQSEEALVRKAEELARSNAELEQLAYTASHDLQEPLRMVISYVQLLQKRYKDKLDSDANEFITFAVEGAMRMKKLIDTMLSFSRLGVQQESAVQSVDCNRVLEEVLQNLKFTIKESGAILTKDSLPIVTGDAMQFVQLFQNLISNAIKFRGKETPRIYISAQEVPEINSLKAKRSAYRETLPSFKQPRQNPKPKNQNLKSKGWLFSVKDNGIGFEQEYGERIFQIFQRLHARSEYSGTGIGLAICQKIVTQNGGQIWAESKPGTGSTFYFTIPDNKSKIVG